MEYQISVDITCDTVSYRENRLSYLTIIELLKESIAASRQRYSSLDYNDKIPTDLYFILEMDLPKINQYQSSSGAIHSMNEKQI